MKGIPKKIALGMIRFYQRAISPMLGGHCRFIPTCSQYTYEAIQIHGFLKGTFLGAKRILKCHPFHPVAYDPVPEKKVRNSKKTK
ncbi:MAG: membrane protein insertion efficiency factor YidD [Cellulosilyticum sp.]|nr:membrane protein insertion efficiency factor YidD [Cellulosilyticum sp.]